RLAVADAALLQAVIAVDWRRDEADLAVALAREVRGHRVGGLEIGDADRHVDRLLAADLADLDDRPRARGEDLARDIPLDEGLQDELRRPPAEEGADRLLLGGRREVTLDEEELVAALMRLVGHALDLLGNARIDQGRHHGPDDPAGAAHAVG